MHTELVTFSATAPGASPGAAMAALTGDSLTIKNSKGPAKCLAFWAWQQGDGYQQVVTPTAHDTTRGMRAVVELGVIDLLTPLGVDYEFEPQETMSITSVGSATAGDVELGQMLLHYDNLPGVTSRAIRWSELQRRTAKLTTIQATLAGTAAGYTGEELITAESDLLQANRDYAVIGITTSVPCAAIYIKGPDTGYQKMAVPGQATDADIGREFFPLISRAWDMPLIPVINSGNKASTYIGFTQNENNISPIVSVMLALLK